MTTRVLASSFNRLPLSPPSLLQRSAATKSLGLLSPPHQIQTQSNFVSQLSHASLHTRSVAHHPSRRAFFSTSTPPHKNGIAVVATPSSSMWTKVAIGGTIALATSATLLNQLSKSPRMEASSSSSSTGNVVLDLKDEHNRIGVEKKSNADIMLSMFVYKLCTFQLLVDMAPKLISLAEMLHVTPPVYWFVRKTFFAQFCGGESADDCIGTMTTLRNAGINSILDLSVEADLDEEELKHQSPSEIRTRYNESADNIAHQISECIETASSMAKSFAAIKITAMGSPLLLKQVSVTLNALESSFKTMDQDRDGKVTKEEFRQLVKMLPSPQLNKDQSLEAMADTLFEEADRDQDGKVDWVDFSATLSMNRDETRSLFQKTRSDATTSVPGLDQEDLEDYKRLLVRMETLCDQAEKTHTRIMIDAEQTYFQPAIDSVALHLQERYNRNETSDDQETAVAGPLIFNTYQMYLRDALGRLQQDYTRAQRNGYVLAAKLVRGAYMVSERRRAQELGLEDPICPGIEATHASYNAGVDFMLGEMMKTRDQLGQKRIEGGSASSSSSSSTSLTLKSSPVVLFVASHNKDSVIRTCERMQEFDLSPQSGLVMFGQLMGMCDQISYTLGQHGYGIYKYVPYAPLHSILPYLVRRAQENSSVLGGVEVERRLLWEELKSRYVTPKTGRAQIQAAVAAAATTVPTPSPASTIVPTGPATTM